MKGDSGGVVVSSALDVSALLFHSNFSYLLKCFHSLQVFTCLQSPVSLECIMVLPEYNVTYSHNHSSATESVQVHGIIVYLLWDSVESKVQSSPVGLTGLVYMMIQVELFSNMSFSIGVLTLVWPEVWV